MSDSIPVAMIGGASTSMIGPVHDAGMTLRGTAHLVAGCFSRDTGRNGESAKSYGVSPERTSEDYVQLLEREAALSSAERAKIVVVATPNFNHAEIALAALKRGFHVVCEKPMTGSLSEADALVDAVRQSGLVFAVAHTYTGHPMVRRARELVQAGALGEIQAVRVRYLQGWLRERVELQGNPQAAWRTDPERSGMAGAFGDIGSHAYNLLRFVTGFEPTELSANLRTLSGGRALDDYGQAALRDASGYIATVTASQVSHGYGNELTLEVDGTEAALRWRVEEPGELWVYRNHTEPEVHRHVPDTKLQALSSDPSWEAVVPLTSLEAFANLYVEVARAVVAGTPPSLEPLSTPFPNVTDGWEVMRFIALSVQSSAKLGAWLPFD